MPEESKAPELKDQMDYAMKHFLFIADQRLRTFHIYVLVAVASVGATLKAASDISNWVLFAAAGVLHISIAIIFWVIEIRNSRLLKVARAGLKEVERQPSWPHYLRLATKEAQGGRVLTFTTAFRAAYFCQSLVGALSIIVSICVLAKPYFSGDKKDQSIAAPMVSEKKANAPTTTIQGETLDKVDSSKD